MGKGLIEELSKSACIIVTDNFPSYFLPKMVKSAARQSKVRLELVDSNGLIPLSANQKAYPSAYAFRRFMQNILPRIILERPNPDSLGKRSDFGAANSGQLISQRWPEASDDLLSGDPEKISGLPIDHDVRPAPARGGHDPLWNAAQTELVREGRIHNYLRMLWGKKILEWTPSSRKALEIMIELNNKYALDGRNSNSYSGIFWTLGRYDRPWGPERNIFGKIRYMSSDRTREKVSVKKYLEKYRSNG